MSAVGLAAKERQRTAQRRWAVENRERMNELQRQYKARNKERVRAATASWREDNKDRISAYGKEKRRTRTPEQVDADRARDRERCARRRAADRAGYNQKLRDWYKDNPERALEKNKRWRASNPDAVKAARARRRGKGRGTFTKADIAAIRKAQNSRCGYCSTRVTVRNEHIDHIIALAKGGSNTRNNLQILCGHCNLRKSSRDAMEFARTEYGFLL